MLDEVGQIENILVAERNVAHRLIEEFMLVANETVAAFLEANDVPTLYRIHEAPDLLKVEQFEEFIATLGYSLSAPMNSVKPRHFQKLVEKLRGKPEERPIATLMLRTMQKARYDTACLGHFGLAAEAYAHFTSPIRRYPDLIVHRTLREFRHGKLSDTLYEERVEELPEVGRHTSEMERRADEAENELVAWKKVRFMADKVGEEYDGFITGRGAVRPVRAARGALCRGARAHLEPGRRLLPLPRARAPAAWREHAPRVPPRRSDPRAGGPRGSGPAAGRPRRRRGARADSGVGAQSRTAVEQGGAEGRAKAGQRPSKGRPGKRERAIKKAVRGRK